MGNHEQLTGWIGGRPTDMTSGRTFTDFNPATGEPVWTVQIASAEDVDLAVSTAADGMWTWARMTGAERGRILREAARLLHQRRDELARLEVIDTGKPIAEARDVDLPTAIEALEFFGGAAAGLHGEHIDLGHAFVYTRREPVGVCAGIGAWNYPLQIACWKAAPALACGNAMVFKPAELTPRTANELAAIFKEAGVPDGVFNVVHGAEETGQALVRHERVAKVSLTGEVETGKAVMADAAGTLKRVTMELGGKSPLLVFPDANLDDAVTGAILANFATQGEVCTNGTRVFVHRDIHDAFMERVIARTEGMRVGDPLDPQTEVGALISEAHLQTVTDYIERGQREGARLRCGGERPSDPPHGAFLTPAVFDHCTDDMRIVREEIFGPVMSVLTFGDEDEVLARANDTPYGLAAGVFTRDLARAHRVVAQLEAGICWVNNYNVTPIEMPFGPFKQSGFGKENGLAAMEHYTQRKSVYVELSELDQT